MRYLPIHIDTKDAKILVVGGGEAAESKLRGLVKTEANLVVVATHISAEIENWAEKARLTHISRGFETADLNGTRLVYVATDDKVQNAEISALAQARQIPVNAADQTEACSFISPAIVDRSPVVISIGTEGTSPGLARAIKADLETRLPSTLGNLANKTKSLRSKLKSILPKISDRQRFWAKVFDHTDLITHLTLTPSELERRYEAILEAGDDHRAGTVTLVGAGPGDPDLLTIAARRALHSADVIVYDRLVSQPVLDLGRREAEYIYVGKEPGGKSTPQDEINEILIAKAKEGLAVIRLKSGDPLIFGRADEELDALEASDIPTSIVPGITSAASAAGEIGASLTTRGKNKAIALMTGHDAKGFAEQDWKSLASNDARAAIYMGVGASRFIQGRLLLHGANRDQPVTVVENASRPEQTILPTTLGQLADDITRHGIKGPAILLLGYAPRGIEMAVTTLNKQAKPA